MFTITASNGLFPAASKAFSLTVDATAPSITPAVSGTLGLSGWYTSNVSVTWTVSEPESPSTLQTSGCGSTQITNDTAASGNTLTCDAHSAGGSNSVSITIKRDATPPTVTCQSPPPVFGVHESGATVSATLGDQSPGSGPGSLVPASPQAADTTTAGAKTVSYSGTDNAGNTSGPIACAYSVRKGDQTISFGALADKVVGDPDFMVSATASSGLAVSFTASGSCTVSGASVHITGAGTCTITASQPGDANYTAAPDVARSFSIRAPLSPALKCVVPKMVGKTLAAAKLALKQKGCRIGKVSHAYSTKTKKGRVASQGRRAGQVLPANTKVNLVVSRGRKP
jgi:hypothetical protein